VFLFTYAAGFQSLSPRRVFSILSTVRFCSFYTLSAPLDTLYLLSYWSSPLLFKINIHHRDRWLKVCCGTDTHARPQTTGRLPGPGAGRMRLLHTRSNYASDKQSARFRGRQRWRCKRAPGYTVNEACTERSLLHYGLCVLCVLCVVVNFP
jgi:hypothetical protein